MKRIITFILSVLMIIGFILPTGAVSVTDQTEEKTDGVELDFFPGYVHKVINNGYVSYERNAAAARDVLRFSAKLEDLEDYQKKNADVNFDGKITAADARILLRYCAKLGGFPVTLRVGQELKFGPFNTLWKLVCLTESSDELKIEREIIPHKKPSNPGDSDRHILHVTPAQPGTYTFEVEQIGYTDEVERYALFEITCIE
ncbi:MAG: dockerin type I repeat-containing protein [Oscillospiraceae bacterium]|nr:dockerin type I repeat-containing protein [Oscillospiraceae bacterium]MDD7353772.1 dockerin type I repeat-containing protein [Oscillospiraceae bacterium]